MEIPVLSYIPVIISILISTFIGYLYWLKQKSKENFNVNLNESLKDVISPIYHKLKCINSTSSPKEREEKLLIFFEEYSSSETKIYKLYDGFVLDWYYSLEICFRKYLNNKSDKTWENFWIKYDAFFLMIEIEFTNSCNYISKEYRWSKKLVGKGFLVRGFYEFSRILYDISKTIMLIHSLIAYSFVYILLFDKNYIQWIEPYYDAYTNILLTSIIIFILLMMVNIEYLSVKSMNQNKNYIQRRIDKLSEYIYYPIDMFRKKVIKVEKEIDVPEMYVKPIETEHNLQEEGE